jgi:dolichol-phosphate mannosyltransferase
MRTLWLGLPAYNEERSLPALLDRCQPVAEALAREGKRLAVIVVDDGSQDATIERAKTFTQPLSLEVIPHVVNRGLGAAITTALLGGLERESDDDAIATMDADNTHDPALLSAMWEQLERDRADVVIASRYVAGGQEVGLSPIRRVLSRGASFLLGLVARVPGARDYTCGFRLYRTTTLRRAREAWGDRFVEEAGFTCMAEILLKLGRGGARVVEHPLVLRYDLKEGASKMKILRTIMRYFALAWRIRTRPLPRVA